MQSLAHSTAMTTEQLQISARPKPVTPWPAIACLSLVTFVLIASEFMPVSLLTPIAAELGISEGQAGQAISISGLFAVLTSLFGNSLLSTWDRRAAVVLYTVVLVVSGLAVTFAPNYLVFMLGRALIGISIGGFWSLSTAILARLARGPDLPKALAMLQGGTALASVIAAPLGSFLGGLIGWRGAFFIVVPIGLAGIVWQLLVLPRLPPTHDVSVGTMVALLRTRVFAIGMAATTLAFMGQFAASTYFRPFLETVTGQDVNGLSLMLLGLGLAGLAGTAVSGFVLRTHLNATLVVLPTALAILSLALVALGSVPVAVAGLLILWGFFSNPIPVGWGTWMTHIIPGELEAGGGLQVALIQFAITVGAFSGGLLFDLTGWQGPFVLCTILLLAAGILAFLATHQRKEPVHDLDAHASHAFGQCLCRPGVAFGGARPNP
jgi:predicted MFS family arabinose efflux permease